MPDPLRTWPSFLAVTVLVVACGARTPLAFEEGADYSNGGSGTDSPGGAGTTGNAGGKDAGVDASADAAADAFQKPDATTVKDDCTDTAATYIYLVTSQSELISFDPAKSTISVKGFLSCPASKGATPFSMAVNRTGTAFVLYSDGKLFRVSTKDGTCQATPYVGGQLGFVQFGMGFATKDLGPAEALYIAATEQGSTVNALGIIDTTTYKVSKVANFTPPQAGAELTGTGDGRLFGFVADPVSALSTHIVQIDKAQAKIIADVKLPGLGLGMAWAFAYWGGKFYLFTSADGSSSRITQYDSLTGKTALIAQISSPVVGAGVSTCAPE